MLYAEAMSEKKNINESFIWEIIIFLRSHNFSQMQEEH